MSDHVESANGIWYFMAVDRPAACTSTHCACSDTHSASAQTVVRAAPRRGTDLAIDHHGHVHRLAFVMSVKAIFISGLASAAIALVGAAGGPETVAAIRTTDQARQRYLAHAIIWQTPPDLSPADLVEGPAGAFSYIREQATGDDRIPCTFARAGRELGGNSAKFLCRTADGRDLRLKYWDPRTHAGNREVFATVAASRLIWALGFNAVPAMSINVSCDSCPDNPMNGSGPRGAKGYVAMLQAFWPTPSILSSDNLDQGWSWRELDTAIRSLPAGAERLQQRTHFDALALLGVFIQHGDRKPEQQRLYCAAPPETTAGKLQKADGRTAILRERAGSGACLSPAVTLLDTGATFGGAGRTSSGITATMDLHAWKDKPVFRNTTRGECRGDLVDSLKAGGDGEPNPIISEEGRRLLLDQLRRLTRDHVRAIFTAARVDQLDSRGIEDTNAWVAVFEDKVQQIDAQHCQPIDIVGGARK
jgi:hypothetical protein